MVFIVSVTFLSISDHSTRILEECIIIPYNANIRHLGIDEISTNRLRFGGFVGLGTFLPSLCSLFCICYNKQNVQERK